MILSYFSQANEDIAKMKLVPSLNGGIYQLKKDNIEVRYKLFILFI